MKNKNSVYNPLIDGDYNVNINEVVNRELGLSERENEHNRGEEPLPFPYYNDDLSSDNLERIEVPEGWNNLPPVVFPPNGIEGGRDMEPISGGPWFPGGPTGGNSISAGNTITPISTGSITLGYYIPRQVVERNCYRSGRDPIVDFDTYNLSLPIENRFGIHLIKNNIDDYVNLNIDAVVNIESGFPIVEQPLYKSYFRYFYWMYVLAHEWGHYFAEVISVSNRKTLLEGYQDEKLIKDLVFKYLNHLDITTSNLLYKQFDFEEVFAEWWGLAYGIFDTKLHKDLGIISYSSTTNYLKIWALKMSFIRGLKRNPVPYSDIEKWIDIKKLLSPKIATDYKMNPDKSLAILTGCPTYMPKDFTMYDIMENNFLSVLSPTSKAKFCPSTGIGFLSPTKKSRKSKSLPATTNERFKILNNSIGPSIIFDFTFLGSSKIKNTKNLRNFKEIMELPEIYIH